MPQYPIKVGTSTVDFDAACGDLVSQLAVTDTEVEILQIRLEVSATGLIQTYKVQGQRASQPKWTIP